MVDPFTAVYLFDFGGRPDAVLHSLTLHLTTPGYVWARVDQIPTQRNDWPDAKTRLILWSIGASVGCYNNHCGTFTGLVEKTLPDWDLLGYT